MYTGILNILLWGADKFSGVSYLYLPIHTDMIIIAPVWENFTHQFSKCSEFGPLGKIMSQNWIEI